METVVHGSPFFPLHKVTTSLFHRPQVSMRVCSGTPAGEVRPAEAHVVFRKEGTWVVWHAGRHQWLGREGRSPTAAERLIRKQLALLPCWDKATRTVLWWQEFPPWVSRWAVVTALASPLLSPSHPQAARAFQSHRPLGLLPQNLKLLSQILQKPQKALFVGEGSWGGCGGGVGTHWTVKSQLESCSCQLFLF